MTFITPKVYKNRIAQSLDLFILLNVTWGIF